MDQDDLSSCLRKLGLPTNHASVGLSNLAASSSQFRSLFLHRRLPDEGLSDVQIQSLLFAMSSLDTNNAAGSRRCGVGEREGRVYSALVSQRHFGFSHGVGRSGDVAEPQPKAVGSSAVARLTLHLTLDAVRRGSGLDGRSAARHGILLPMCTGMSMALTLRSLRRGPDELRDVVLWCRIDQKSCFKAIATAGLRCEVVPTRQTGDEVRTDLDALRGAIGRIGRENILAVVTTTSCFAPRVPDQVDEVARVCAECSVEGGEGISHIINNAYGLQCERTSKLINRACAVGRVDAIICSTDKNFMVPVGGAIALSPKKDVVENIGKIYAGRASASPCIDLFITLLSMGLDGYRRILSDRRGLLPSFEARLAEVAARHGERCLSCPENTISFGITLNTLGGWRRRRRPQQQSDDGGVGAGDDGDDDNDGGQGDSSPSNDAEALKREGLDISYFGSMLFTRCVSGTRVVPRGQSKAIGGHEFVGFGSSTDEYSDSYLTAACAIGVTEKELDEFFFRLDKAFKDFFVQSEKREKKKNSMTN